MKNLKLIILLLFAIGVAFTSCNKDDEDDDIIIAPEDVVLGEIKVVLDVNKAYVRTHEAEAGNFVSDAMKEYAVSKGQTVDFGCYNGGGIRFDSDTRTDGIYPAGDFTVGNADELFPFSNTIMVVEITGEELKTIFEHSVAGLPDDVGQFLQVSKEVKIEIDSTLQAQVVDETTDPDNPVIATPGLRITSLKINGTEFDSTATYKFAISNYIAEGGDSYVTLKNLDATKRTDLVDFTQEALKLYLETHSPITPQKEGRIVFK